MLYNLTVNAPSPYGGRSSFGDVFDGCPSAISVCTAASLIWFRCVCVCVFVWFSTKCPAATIWFTMEACDLAQVPTRKNRPRTLYALSVSRIELRFAWLVYPCDLQLLDGDPHRSGRGGQDLVPHPDGLPHLGRYLRCCARGCHPVRQGPVWRHDPAVHRRCGGVLGHRGTPWSGDLRHHLAAPTG